MSEETTKIQFKTDLFIIIITGFFNISLGLFLIYVGITFVDPNSWYLLIHFGFSFLILSYPFIHYRDRKKEYSKPSN